MKKDVAIFLQDYFTMSAYDLADKYSAMYAEYPTVEEIFAYIKANGLESKMIDDPNDTSKHPCLIADLERDRFQIFNHFRGLHVSETDFKTLDEAIIGKFDRLIGGIRGSRRW